MRLNGQHAIVIEKGRVFAKRIGPDHGRAFGAFDHLILMPGQKAHIFAVDLVIGVAHGPAVIEFHDFAAHCLRDPDGLRQTLAIRPEYLKTHGAEDIIDYSEWSIPRGRRFRALKLWFLMRHYGMEGLRTRIRNHVKWSQALCERLRREDGFEIVTEPIMSLWTFKPRGASDSQTQALVDAINDDGRIYLTQTLVDGQKVIRFTAGQFDCEERDFDTAFDTITELEIGRAHV